MNRFEFDDRGFLDRLGEPAHDRRLADAPCFLTDQ